MWSAEADSRQMASLQVSLQEYNMMLEEMWEVRIQIKE
jgi:hypothetical protein